MPDIVNVEYQQTGNSTCTNTYGMREMQERAFEYRDAQYMLLKSLNEIMDFTKKLECPRCNRRELNFEIEGMWD